MGIVLYFSYILYTSLEVLIITSVTKSNVTSCLHSVSCCLCPQLRDEELSKESQESNWFSAPSALRVYGEIPFFVVVAVVVFCCVARLDGGE